MADDELERIARRWAAHVDDGGDVAEAPARAASGTRRGRPPKRPRDRARHVVKSRFTDAELAVLVELREAGRHGATTDTIRAGLALLWEQHRRSIFEGPRKSSGKSLAEAARDLRGPSEGPRKAGTGPPAHRGHESEGPNSVAALFGPGNPQPSPTRVKK